MWRRIDRATGSKTTNTGLARQGRVLSTAGMILVISWLAACGSSGLSVAPTLTAPPLAATLIFYDWLDDMPQPVLDAFTKEYGVKVKVLAYEAQEGAIKDMKAGQAFDIVVMDSRFIPLLAQAGLLAEIDPSHIPNLKNISLSFRELAYDPGNRYSVPYNWGTWGLVVRTDLVKAPVAHWADLWDERYAGRIGMWFGSPREVLGLTLKSLGYSVNTTDPQELEAALQRLRSLKPNLVRMEDFGLGDASAIMASGRLVLAMGEGRDAVMNGGRNHSVDYVLPDEGALLWNDTFVIPANSPNKATAELFLNFMLRPTIAAQIANENYYATPNEAARPFIDPALLNDPLIFPPNESLVKAELILPLSQAGQTLYDDIWQRFLGTP